MFEWLKLYLGYVYFLRKPQYVNNNNNNKNCIRSIRILEVTLCRSIKKLQSKLSAINLAFVSEEN